MCTAIESPAAMASHVDPTERAPQRHATTGVLAEERAIRVATACSIVGALAKLGAGAAAPTCMASYCGGQCGFSVACRRTLEISAPHPTADGRVFGDLHAGDSLDGRAIESIEVIGYTHEFTYDILPGSDTGTYFAAGMQIGSTLYRGAKGI